MTTKYTYSEGATYQSESTPITVGKIPIGKYKIKAVKGDLEGKATFTSSPGTQVLSITISEPVYSIIYDKSLASDPAGCLTYAGLCEGFTPMVGGSGTVNEGSWAEGNGTLFDSIEVGYFNGSTWYSQNKRNVAGSTSYNCFTRIPKIYQKITALDSNRVQVDLSTKTFSGASLHPSFIVDGVEKEYIYIGRYLGYKSNSKLTSISGSDLTASTTTRPKFRTLAKANGSDYHLLWYWDWDLVGKLYLLAFRNFNSQTALGAGYTNASTKQVTGETDGKSWMYGTSSITDHISFLGIEDWYGNLMMFIDNFLGYAGTYYVGNFANPSDSSTSGYTNMGSFDGSPASYPLTCRGGENNFFISESKGGSSTTGICDTQDWSVGSVYSLGYVGGYRSGGSASGAFHLAAEDRVSFSNSNIGARLTYKP